MRKLLQSSLIVRDWPSDGNDWFIIWEVFCLILRLDPVVEISPEPCNGVTLVEWSSIVRSSDTMKMLKESWIEKNWKQSETEKFLELLETLFFEICFSVRGDSFLYVFKVGYTL